MATAPNLTERQAKYFASLRDGLEAATGRGLAEWIEIARDCPEAKHRARLAWFKQTHGLLQNRASLVIDAAFGAVEPWSEAENLIDRLWADPAQRPIYDAIDAAAMRVPGAIRTARKAYTAWSRTVQFAAARPLKAGTAMLGMSIPADAHPTLEASRNEPWSERLRSRIRIHGPDQVDDRISTLLAAAADRS